MFVRTGKVAVRSKALYGKMTSRSCPAVLAIVNVIFGFMFCSKVCCVLLTVYISSLASHCKPSSDSNLLQTLVGRYIKGIVESINMEIVSDIRVTGVVIVETPVGTYFIVVSSTINLRELSS